ncbi:hypothetical protein V5E97_35330 [Singulisphaera sp. Ch08]|uniref:Golvesin/Xly CBD-like domain-containing protein n=1 Tax=Singulisphaera sp. Ch08 TaxID=3120278 RepID=A0AAU7CEH5_9BACT
MRALLRLGERIRILNNRHVSARRQRSGSHRWSLEAGILLEDRCLLAPVWISQGPNVIQNGQVEGMAAQQNPVIGAAQSVVAHPTNSNILWVGTVNGGVWRTDNATASSPSWTPLTDYLPSLSIGALALDPTDATSNTLVAGIGRYSSFQSDGGSLTGLIRTTDGGNSWSLMGQSVLSGRRVSGVAGRGNLILASSTSFTIGGVTNEGRLVRSTDAGVSFSVVSGTGGLPTGPVLDLVTDPASPATFFAATTSGIFRSTDDGVNWVNVTPVGAPISNASSNLEMAVHSSATQHVVYLGVLNNGRLAAIYRSETAGNAWTAMDIPEVVEVDTNPITGATNAAPIVVTSASHGQRTGDRVLISGVTGNTAANGTWTITVGNANTFSLNGSTGNGAYAGGGVWRAVQGLEPVRPIVPVMEGEDISGGQGSIHFSIVADPTNPNVVYLGGDRQPLSRGSNTGGFPNAIGATSFTGRLFRGDAAQPSGSQWTPLTHNFADPDGVGSGLPGSAPHADSREMTFDAAGNLIEADDGGVYRRSNPTSSTGIWTSLNGNLQNTEIYAGGLAYDPLNNILVGGAQDTGSSQQSAAGSTTWVTLNQADGSVIQTAIVGGNSVRYSSSQTLGGSPGGFRRRTYNGSNTLLSNVAVGLNVVGLGNLFSVDSGAQFLNPYELNAVDPTRMLIGTANGLYESFDQGDNLNKLDLGAGVTPGFTRSLAYGGTGNAAVIYFGGNTPETQLMVRTGAGGPFTLLSTFPGFYTRDIAVDPSDWRIAYLIDYNGRLWRTTDAGATSGGWTELTGNNNSLDGDARSITVMPGVVMVGGRSGAHFMRTSQPTVWRELGTGMPNAPVNDLRYNATDNVVTSGTFGRGAWMISNVAAELSDSLAPTADILDVAPDPRSTSVMAVGITFSEAVNGFDLSGLNLIRDGVTLALNAAIQTLSTTDGIHWILGNLANLTSAVGLYTLTLNVATSGIFDGAGNALTGSVADTWTVTTAPPNDNFAAATPLSGTPVSVAGSNVLATGESGEPDHAGISAPLQSVWWNWTALVSGPVLIDTLGSEFDTTLAVYTGTALNALTLVASNDDIPGMSQQSRVTFTAVAGTIYHIAVDSFGTLSGPITLTIRPQPSVSLTLSGNPLAEPGGVATVTATLSGVSSLPVTVNLAFTGTATLNSDYTPSANLITIPAGQTSGSLTLTGVDDALNEGSETIVVDVMSVINGLELGTQQVTATITDDERVRFVDGGGPGYSEVGPWVGFTGGYGGTARYVGPGTGSSVATWLQTGLAPGNYEVQVTWLAGGNRASNAPYRIYDGNTLLKTVRIDQRTAPSGSVTSGGVTFQTLGSVVITGTTLRIELANDADNYIIADAVRIGDPIPFAPIIGDDGQASYHQSGPWSGFAGGYGGTARYVSPGTGSSVATWLQTGLAPGSYEVQVTWLAGGNRASNAPYRMYDGSTLLKTVRIDQRTSPSGSVTSGGVTFQTLGSVVINGGTLRVELANDADGYLIADAVRIGDPTPFAPIIGDDGQAGYSQSGPWSSFAGGYSGTARYVGPGTGSSAATWLQTGLAPGSYEVQVTWLAGGNRASNAPYRIYDGSTLLKTVRIDQRTAPSGSVTSGGVTFQTLGSVVITGTTLRVELANDADNYIVADAVRIGEPTTFAPIIGDDGQAGYNQSGPWSSFAGGYGGTARYVGPGTGSSVATWQQTGLAPGSYEVQVTWLAGGNRASNAPYRIYDGNTLLKTVRIDQRTAPSGGVTSGGVTFQSLGSVVITGTTLRVELANDADNYIIADAVRVSAAIALPDTGGTISQADGIGKAKVVGSAIDTKAGGSERFKKWLGEREGLAHQRLRAVDHFESLHESHLQAPQDSSIAWPGDWSLKKAMIRDRAKNPMARVVSATVFR